MQPRPDIPFAFNPKRNDHAYFLGLLATDGTISETTRNRGRVSFELKLADASVLRALAECIPYSSHVSERCRNTNFSLGYESVVLTLHDLRFRRELAALGYGSGKKAESVSSPCCDYDEEGFWRGVVDGDGSLGITGNQRAFVSLVTASGPLRNAYVDYVARVAGVRPNPNRNTRDRVFNIVLFDEPAQALVTRLYSDGCIGIPRKAAAAKLVEAWRRPAGRRRIDFERRKWTRQEDRRVLENLPQQVLAAELGRTKRSINIRRWRLRASSRGAAGSQQSI